MTNEKCHMENGKYSLGRFALLLRVISLSQSARPSLKIGLKWFEETASPSTISLPPCFVVLFNIGPDGCLILVLLDTVREG